VGNPFLGSGGSRNIELAARFGFQGSATQFSMNRQRRRAQFWQEGAGFVLLAHAVDGRSAGPESAAEPSRQTR
jgi:hypothetical protein